MPLFRELDYLTVPSVSLFFYPPEIPLPVLLMNSH